MPTFNINTTAVAVGAFHAGDTVSIIVYDIDKNSAPIELPLDTNVCTELFSDLGVSTEVFRWSFSSLTGGQVIGNFLYQMKNQDGLTQTDIFQIVPDGGISPGPIYSVSIQLYEYDVVNSIASTTPIINAPTYIYNADESVVITIKNSDSTGQVTIPLNDGTYVVAPQKAGTAFIKETITISNGIITQVGGGIVTNVIVYGSVYTVPAPENVINACRVYEHCFNVDSITPLSSLTSSAQIQTEFYNTNTKLHTVQTVPGIYNPTTGLVYWDIVWGSKVLFSIQETGVSRTVTVPSVLVSRLTDI